jgi:hypothetical protein
VVASLHCFLFSQECPFTDLHTKHEVRIIEPLYLKRNPRQVPALLITIVTILTLFAAATSVTNMLNWVGLLTGIIVVVAVLFLFLSVLIDKVFPIIGRAWRWLFPRRVRENKGASMRQLITQLMEAKRGSRICPIIELPEEPTE